MHRYPMSDKPNFDRINRISAATDFYGNKLEIGCRVRVFHFYTYDPDSDECEGITPDKFGYFEGVLLGIGDAPEDPQFPGPRYTIRVNLSAFVRPNAIEPTRREQDTRDIITPPVNGTVVQFRGKDLGWKTFGVFAITNESNPS